MSTDLKLPPSSISLQTGCIGLATILFLLFAFDPQQYGLSTSEGAIVFLCLTFLSMAVFEIVFIKPWRAPDSDLDFSKTFHIGAFLNSFDKDFLIKLCGITLTVLFAGIYFWVSDIYMGEDYKDFMQALSNYWPYFAAVFALYITVIHYYMRHPKDSYWHLGALLFRKGQSDLKIVKRHLLATAIKMFFVPLMFMFFMNDFRYFYDTGSANAPDPFDVTIRLMFFIDVCLATIGYMTTMRLFNAHIRWPEQTMAGWVVCLLCYPPFWQILGRDFLAYGDGLEWPQKLAGAPEFILGLWAFGLILFTGLYTFTTVQFGLRFSNLTHRGIITGGLFRWTKHPAYISKNITWWMISIPFLTADPVNGVRNTLALIGLNIIYYLRARYEERCLSEDPVYRDYAAYVNEYGIFARLKKRLSSFR